MSTSRNFGGNTQETVTRKPVSEGEQDLQTWWSRYASGLSTSSLTPTAQKVVELDSRYICESGIFGDGDPAEGNWPIGRSRQGLVMGAVQSGKTASMLGVAALCLDRNVDMIVVLAGTRLTLWRQTFERIVSQLDRGFQNGAERARARILVPDPALVFAEDIDLAPSRLYSLQGAVMRRSVESHTPILVVAMKNAHHLRALRTSIDNRLVPIVRELDRPFHLVVLDDEADDGSILDAEVESSQDPSVNDLKQIPRAIVDLWSNRPHEDKTKTGNLYSNYLAYTATPQANILQSDHNPLAPRNFLISLRTPFDNGDVETRSTTYREPVGIESYYTGGETYYSRLTNGLCEITSGNADLDLADALRSYFVAGAIRRWRDQDRMGVGEVRAAEFQTATEVRKHSPKPHSMLVHPSGVIADQFEAASNILRVACGYDQEASVAMITEGIRDLPSTSFASTMADHEDAWIDWLSRFNDSSLKVQSAFDIETPPAIPKASDWPQIRKIILEDLVPNTRLKIVNSDEQADERPQFEPIEKDGVWTAAPDLCTIFVSGNVMARGLTLEGLTTTLFVRNSTNPFADTQMQMQRWFGYRGSYLELSRVFLTQSQLELFRAYHDTDEALRRTVIDGMNHPRESGGNAVVLQGQDFTATGKLANLANVPLCPGATPFVRLINSQSILDPNLEVVAAIFRESESVEIRTNDKPRGRLLTEPLDLLAAADLLDELAYVDHRPSTNGWEARRWLDLEAKVGISYEEDNEGVLPFFRPPHYTDEPTTVTARGGPYAISAYLRLWKACLTRRARGLVGTDDMSTPWQLVDIEKKHREQPRFYVGIRYGRGDEISSEYLSGLNFPVRTMERAIQGNQLEGGWGSRNVGQSIGSFFGDELFDYHYHARKLPVVEEGEPLWRKPGEPGLILFYLVDRGESKSPAVALGVALPLGGPDQFAARKPSDRLGIIS